MVTTSDPECRNGNVAFTFAADPGAPLKFKCRITRPGTTITEPAGDVIFTYDAAGKQWMGDYATTFGTVRWTLHTANAQIAYGYLVQLPLLHVNRRVNLKRVGLK
jgi:hypothetical protein